MERAVLEFLITIKNAIDKLLTQYAPKTLDEVKQKIPKELADLLSFEENEQYFILKPRQFLGAQNFSEILNAIKTLGGEYISKGKDSHFRLLKGA